MQCPQWPACISEKYALHLEDVGGALPISEAPEVVELDLPRDERFAKGSDGTRLTIIYEMLQRISTHDSETVRADMWRETAHAKMRETENLLQTNAELLQQISSLQSQLLNLQCASIQSLISSGNRNVSDLQTRAEKAEAKRDELTAAAEETLRRIEQFKQVLNR